MNDSPLEKPLEKKPATEPAADAVRASDADRDRVADVLREALAEGRLDPAEHAERIDSAYSAKTVGELEPLVRDLPQGQPHKSARPAPAGSPAPPPAPSGWQAVKDNLVAIFSGSVRKGRYRVPEKINAFAFCGGVEIDLTEAVFAYQHVHINTTAVFGGIDIRVPENVTLVQKGAGVFGGFDVHATEASDPDAPVVLVQGAALFGGVTAKPKRGKQVADLGGRGEREAYRRELRAERREDQRERRRERRPRRR